MANIKNETWAGHSVNDTSPGGWIVNNSGWKVQNTTVFSAPNALQFGFAGGTTTMYWPVASTYRGYDSVRAVFRFHAVASEQTWGLYLRASSTDGNNGYFVQIEPTGSLGAGVGLYKVVNGTFTQLGSNIGTGTQITLDTWFRVWLIGKGSTIIVRVQRMTDNRWLGSSGLFSTFQVDGISQTDATWRDGGHAGLYAAQSVSETQAIYSDDFAFDTLQAFVADSTATSGTVSSLTVNVPASTIDGDILIACIEWNSSTTTITPPAGWTSIRSDTVGGMQQALYRHVAQAEPANYAWAFSASVITTATMLAVRSADIVSVIDVHGGNTGMNSNVTAPSVTTAVANDLLLLFAGDDAAVGLITPPGTNQDKYVQDVTGSAELLAADLAFAGPGATDVETFGGPPAPSDWVGQTVAILSVASPPWDGTWGPSQFIQSADPVAQWRATELASY